MPIDTTCPNCDASYTLADKMLGKRVRCKSCSEPFTIEATSPNERSASPKRSGTEASGDSEEIADAVLLDEDLPRRRRFRDDKDDDEPRGRRRGPRKRSGKGMPVWIWFAVGGGVLMMMVVGLVVFLFATGAIGNKVTIENAKKVKHGMSPDEVVDILGKPDQKISMGFQASYVWQRSNGQVTIVFMDNKVVGIAMQFQE